MDYTLSLRAPGEAVTPRGTVVLLHGWMMDGGSLLPWSVELAQRGYRTIAIDLRNHGRSGPGASGYGTREAGDVVAVLRQLRAQGEVVGPLHVMGVSYGAATAIFTARELGAGGAQVDDLQLGGVVAMESFDNAGRAIRDMVPHMLQRAPDSLGERLSQDWLRWRFDRATPKARSPRPTVACSWTLIVSTSAPRWRWPRPACCCCTAATMRTCRSRTAAPLPQPHRARAT